ncbi:MAG: methyltransferase domain-containing protein [Inquilinus sp.]|nr:methyltransferase domain-containing protein [Inquilinus sp.]
MPEPGSAATDDRLLDGRIVLRQPATGYRAAIDPVLLAAAVPNTRGTVLELGCGAGAAALCLAWRVPECRVVGLELQPGLAALARDNAAASGLAARVEILAGDLCDPPPALAAGSFDGVMVNPPYFEAGAHTPPPDGGKALAHQEGNAALAAWTAAATRYLRPKGWLTMIHRVDRLIELCARLWPDYGAIEIVPLWPKPGRPARRVVVRARKAVGNPAVLLPGLVLHEADGRFTAAADAILRDGAPLAL